MKLSLHLIAVSMICVFATQTAFANGKPEFASGLFDPLGASVKNVLGSTVDLKFLRNVGDNFGRKLVASGQCLVESLYPQKEIAEIQAVVYVPTQRQARAARPVKEHIPENDSPVDNKGIETVPEEVDGLLLTIAERSVIAITNSERARRGLRPLLPDRKLMESARRHAAWMSVTGIFRHGNARAAENIAMGQRTSAAAMRSWMNSTGHRQNLLASNHGKIGVGAYLSPGGQLYWCQQFVR